MAKRTYEIFLLMLLYNIKHNMTSTALHSRSHFRIFRSNSSSLFDGKIITSAHNTFQNQSNRVETLYCTFLKRWQIVQFDLEPCLARWPIPPVILAFSIRLSTKSVV